MREDKRKNICYTGYSSQDSIQERKPRHRASHKRLCPAAMCRQHEESQLPQQQNWDWLIKNVKSKADLVDVKLNAKNSQFATPLFEFSGACSGCGETPYLKLISQLYGDHQMVANATGCSSIYSGSVPSTPYTTDENGHGPAWANSLFEDFCEFGLGMYLGYEKMRARLEDICVKLEADENAPQALRAAAKAWYENRDDAKLSHNLGYEFAEEAKKNADKCETCATIVNLRHYLTKRSQWIVGGDGASYDIGFGGLDHVIAILALVLKCGIIAPEVPVTAFYSLFLLFLALTHSFLDTMVDTGSVSDDQ